MGRFPALRAFRLSEISLAKKLVNFSKFFSNNKILLDVSRSFRGGHQAPSDPRSHRGSGFFLTDIEFHRPLTIDISLARIPGGLDLEKFSKFFSNNILLLDGNHDFTFASGTVL